MPCLLLLATVLHAQGKECSTTLITLAPSLTELAFEAGAGDCLVGVAAYSDWPPEASRLPVIGDAFGYDLERIAILAPDHALAWQGGSPPARVARLEALGIEVTWIKTQALDDIPRALTAIARMAGDPNRAQAAVREFNSRLEALQPPGPPASPIRVLYQIADRPLFTLGGQHILDDVITRCGGENVFSELGIEAAAIDIEAVLAAAPEVIIAGAEPDQPDPLALWRSFPDLPATANNQLHTADPDLLTRPTTRILDGMAWLCGTISASHH